MEGRKFTNEQFADMLYKSLKNSEPIEVISDVEPLLTVEDAYNIQLINVKRSVDDGEKITGKKVGLTSKAMQELLGITEPDYGHLYASTEIKNGGTVYMNNLIRPKVEGEIAFVLKEDLIGPNITIEDVYKATDYICASIEIVDSRIKDWKIKLIDTIADNGSSSMYILNETKVKLDDVSLPDIEMTLYKNGEEINQGTAAEVLGNPAVSVAWLANKLYGFGVKLKKDDVILSGAITAAPEAQQGDVFECVFNKLGSVKIEFK